MQGPLKSCGSRVFTHSYINRTAANNSHLSWSFHSTKQMANNYVPRKPQEDTQQRQTQTAQVSHRQCKQYQPSLQQTAAQAAHANGRSRVMGLTTRQSSTLSFVALRCSQIQEDRLSRRPTIRPFYKGYCAQHKRSDGGITAYTHAAQGSPQHSGSTRQQPPVWSAHDVEVAVR